MRGLEGGIDIEFYSENKEEIAKMMSDFLELCKGRYDVDGFEFCEKYLPDLAHYIGRDKDLSHNCDFVTSEQDIVPIEGGFALTVRDTDVRVPALFGAITERHYPSVETRYASWVYDNENEHIDYYRYDPEGKMTGGKKYNAVYCLNLNGALVQMEEGSVDTKEEADKIAKESNYGTVFLNEWKDVKAADAVLYSGKKFKDIDFGKGGKA